MKVLVVDFSNANHIVELLPRGLDLFVEKKDGGRAYKIAGEEMPDIIIINYKDKPSHGRQTAISIKERKKTSHIPIYFVDGNEGVMDKVNQLGICMDMNELVSLLESKINANA
jgi:DNA-binding response OmpR family regulator